VGRLAKGAWFDVNTPNNIEGSKEVADFAQFVVEHVLSEEYYLGTDKSQVLSTFRLFCRVDVCLEWSDEDKQFRLKVGEIQQAMCGLLDVDNSDCWVIANEFCNALESPALFGTNVLF